MLAKRHKTNEAASVVVIGLGRFGAAVAHSLVQMGKEVLAIDEVPRTLSGKVLEVPVKRILMGELDGPRSRTLRVQVWGIA